MIFDNLVARFQRADRNLRLDTLLAYSGKLAPLPEALADGVDRERHRVTECQTPVFLWIGVEHDTVSLHADVPRESPTVRGYVSLLQSRIAGASPRDVAAIPNDLLDHLRLTEALGMTRTQGLTAILDRIKRAVVDASGG